MDNSVAIRLSKQSTVLHTDDADNDINSRRTTCWELYGYITGPHVKSGVVTLLSA